MSEKHYVDDKLLQQHLLEWQTARKTDPDLRVPEEVGEAIMKIANNFARRWNYYNYTWRDEMVGDAIETCCRYIKNYDPWKYKKPLNYITYICMNSFHQRIKKEKKQNALKYKHFVDNVYDENDSDMMREVDPEFYQNMLQKVHEYETSNAAPKSVRKEAEAREQQGGLSQYYD